MRRRALLGGLAAAALPGALTACGFRPVYMPSAGGAPGPAVRNLAAIDVALIPERSGQLLREALQQRFQGADDSAARHYMLHVSYWISEQGIGILQSTTATHIRYIANANWVLTSNDPAATRITTGYARATDGADVFDEQYFALDLETNTIYRRLAGQVADQIATRLAMYFREQAAHRALPRTAAG